MVTVHRPRKSMRWSKCSACGAIDQAHRMQYASEDKPGRLLLCDQCAEHRRRLRGAS